MLFQKWSIYKMTAIKKETTVVIDRQEENQCKDDNQNNNPRSHDGEHGEHIFVTQVVDQNANRKHHILLQEEENTIHPNLFLRWDTTTTITLNRTYPNGRGDCNFQNTVIIVDIEKQKQHSDPDDNNTEKEQTQILISTRFHNNTNGFENKLDDMSKNVP